MRFGLRSDKAGQPLPSRAIGFGAGDRNGQEVTQVGHRVSHCSKALTLTSPVRP
jgi:hypothetical protein